MIVGNVPEVPSSIFDPAYPLPALLANNYGEMMSIPLYNSALLLSAMILLLVVGAFNVTAHLTLLRIEGIEPLKRISDFGFRISDWGLRRC